MVQVSAAPPLPSEEALQQAQVEGLVLRVGRNRTGYLGVHLTNPGQSKPYEAQVKRGGKTVHLGRFATAEEAALCIARSPEGQAAAGRAAERAAERAARQGKTREAKAAGSLWPSQRKGKAFVAKKVEEWGLSEQELAQRQQAYTHIYIYMYIYICVYAHIHDMCMCMSMHMCMSICMWLQAPSHAVTGVITYGDRRHHTRLKESSHTVTGSNTYGYRRHPVWLQAPSHTVTGCATCRSACSRR